MYVQVTKVIMVTISIVNYVAFTCDEVNFMDNGSWISIHTYMMLNWVKVPMMFSLQRVVNGSGADNLIFVIMEALQKGEGLNLTFVFQKLFCFAIDGVSKFQRTKIGVTKQINTNYAHFSIGVHCMAHRGNLAFQALSTLGIVSSIKDLPQCCHAYFVHSPNKHFEFIKLINMMETKGFKMLKNVKIH